MALPVSHELLLAGGTGLQPYSNVFLRPQQRVGAYLCKRKPWEDGLPTVVGLPRR